MFYWRKKGPTFATVFLLFVSCERICFSDVKIVFCKVTSFCLFVCAFLFVCFVLCYPLRDGLEDPLDDAGLVQQQLDQLSTIGRCEYEKTCALLVQLFDQSAQSYQELLQSTNSSTMDIAVQEGEFAQRNHTQQPVTNLPLQECNQHEIRLFIQA